MTSDLRSPFVDRVINLLPQGHEEAMKQAFYNVAAICLFIALGSATTAVYFILEPFVKPLLWAILIGSVLHPVKQRSVFLARKWLSDIRDSNTLLVFGFLTIPLIAVDYSAEWMGAAIQRNMKLVIPLTFGIPFVYVVQYYYSFSDFVQAYDQIVGFFLLIPLVLGKPYTGVIVIVIISLLTIMSTASKNFKLQLISHAVWVMAFIGLVSLCGSFRVVLIPLTLLLVMVAVAIRYGWIKEDCKSVAAGKDDTAKGKGAIKQDPAHSSGFTSLLKSPIVVAALSSLAVPSAADKPKKKKKSSNRYIYGALWACLVVQLWRHSWLLHLFPIPVVCYIIKSIGSYLNVWNFLRGQKSSIGHFVASWVVLYKDHIFPRPLQWIFKAVVYLDRMVIKKLMSQVDAVVTSVLICVVVILTVLASVFVAVQIYGESVHLVQSGTRVLNHTVSNPETRQWLPQGVEQAVGSVFENAYAYGKTGIASLIRNTIQEKDPVKAAQIESAIVDALDKIQGAWQTPNKSLHNKAVVSESNYPSNGTELKTKPPLLKRLSQDFLNPTVLMNFGRENLGMIFSILESIWNLLKGNLSLVIRSSTSFVSILMGGGTAILNFCVNGVIFLTALFYLLVASDSQYKPIQMVSVLSPAGGNTLGTAMEEAITTVCMASFKLAAFYGLWTWLIHTVFQVNFVVIPAALAALFGAVPFLGTYWAALPAALDLWLAQGRGIEAILLTVFQFLPTLLVDATFYSEIKGGGHPYLTGLAVAGGIFWLGVEGAIIGPLLLCVLLASVSVYSSLFQDSQSVDSSRLFHRRLLRTDTVG